MRARFDLVGLDPRGIGASTPLRCFDTLDQALGVLPPFPFPVTAAEERLWVDADRTFARACAGRGGPILDHMATADVARDLDLLRQAVGDRQLTYVGLSYGAYLGATYANLFPAKVRALVLDGVPDPVAWATGRGDQAATWPLFNRVGSAEGASATLGEFFRLCDQGGPACAFSQGDPRRRYQALARRLAANPVQTPDGPVGYADLVYAHPAGLAGPGGVAGAGPAARAARQPDPASRRRRPPGSERPSPTTPTFSRVWPAWPAPTATTRTRSAPGSGPRTPPTAPRPTSAATGPGSPASASHGPDTTPTATSVPGPRRLSTRSWSSATDSTRPPPTGGRSSLARLLPRSRLLTLNGWGHTAEGKSSCIDAHTARYLLTTQVPSGGTVCQPDLVPFAHPSAQTAGSPTKPARS